LTRRIVAVALLTAAVAGLFVGMGIGLFEVKPAGTTRAADVSAQAPEATSEPTEVPTPTPTPSPTQVVGPRRDVSYVVTNGFNRLAADVAGASRASGTPVILFQPHGQANQQWIVQDAGSGSVFLVSVSSGKCLQIRRFSNQPGATAVQAACTGRDPQRWQFGVNQDGWSLTSDNSGLRLDASDDQINGLRRLVQKQPEENARSQVWYFTPVG
jgi:hypothetical protein